MKSYANNWKRSSSQSIKQINKSESMDYMDMEDQNPKT